MIVYALLGGMYCSPLFAKNEFMNIFTRMHYENSF